MSGHRARLALLTEIISPYRIAAFNELAADGRIDLDVFFFAETEDRRYWQRPDASTMRFNHHVLDGWIVGRRYQTGSLFFNPGILRHLRRASYDVVVTGGYHHPTIWLVLLYCRMTRTRILVWSESTARDARTSGRFSEAFKRQLIRRFDGFIAAGSAQREYLRLLGAAADRTWVAPDSVDVEFYGRAVDRRATSQHGLKATLGLQGPVVLYVGRLIDEKGIPDLLDAFTSVRRQVGASMLLVGDGVDRPKYEADCAARGLTDVRFAGFVQPGNLIDYYAAADVFAFPTHSDPWGLAINEAMAAGLPIVASSAAGAVDDLVEHGDNGFVHAPGDTAALADSLRALLDDGALRRRMGGRSRARLAGYTPQLMAQGIAEAVLQMPNLAFDASGRTAAKGTRA